jgi:hypothetical protein
VCFIRTTKGFFNSLNTLARPGEQEVLDPLNFLARLLLDSTASLTLHAVRSGRVYTSFIPSFLALLYYSNPV